jgi:hypothetical protein
VAVGSSSDVAWTEHSSGGVPLRGVSAGGGDPIPCRARRIVRCSTFPLENCLHADAIHNHMETGHRGSPECTGTRTGAGPTFARGIAAALAHMNGARKSASER